MKDKRKQNCIWILIFLCLLLVAIFFLIKSIGKNKNNGVNASSIPMEINTDDDDEKIDWSRYENTSYELTKSITITKEGIYNLT